MIKCEICNKEFKIRRALSNHIVRTHKILLEEYYLKYISIDPMDGKCHCDGCNNKTNFDGIGKGFYRYCSYKCVVLSTEVKEKLKKTNLKRYGVEYASQSDDIKNKKKQTCLHNYGVENPLQLNEVKEKSKQTCLNKYGVKFSLQAKEVKEKIKKTNLERYGVENPSQSEEIRTKVKNTCLEKFGTDNPSKDKKIKNKIKQIKFEMFFNSLFTSSRLQNKVIPNFTLENYNGKYYKYSWKCTQCNTIFKDHINNGHIPRCFKCYPLLTGTSKGEQEVFSFVQQYFPDAENRNRTIISPIELDIYISSKQFAIEFDGLFWHSEINGEKDKDYHLNKSNECTKNNIKLIHIFEDEWINKQEIVKSIILSKLGLISNKIPARKCILSSVKNNEAKLFLDNNHLQGSINGKHIGLYYNDELVSILTYGKPRFNKKYEIEIFRFCNKLNTIVIGGLSKLIKNLNSNSILTYADIRYGDGNSYKQCGFNKIGKSEPSYYYTNDYINRESRLLYRKHLLESKLEEFDPSLTEWQNMQLSGYDRIWDCGNYIYGYKL